MRILFWGTPEFAVPSLRALLGEGYDVVGVVTRPDRPAGRGRKLRSSPVRIEAESEGIPVLVPERPRGDAFLAELRAFEPDLSVVVAYGHILRPEVLDLPKRGSVNIHASLLPELRGAAPIHWAIARGYTETGITLMRMSEGMDEGPILLQRALPIDPDDTTSSLSPRLSELGAATLIETLILFNELVPIEQDHALATYAPRVDRETARVDWALPAEAVARHIRAMDAVPGAWTEFDGAPVKLFGPRVLSGPEGAGAMASAAAGERIGAWPGRPADGRSGDAQHEDALVIATGEGGAVAIDEVQPAGKRRMPAEDWIRGMRG